MRNKMFSGIILLGVLVLLSTILMVYSKVFYKKTSNSNSGHIIDVATNEEHKMLPDSFKKEKKLIEKDFNFLKKGMDKEYIIEKIAQPYYIKASGASAVQLISYKLKNGEFEMLFGSSNNLMIWRYIP